jgi:NAD(P)-dependent dehydrogenase (short-subunit alcohol dehydrogenase family)
MEKPMLLEDKVAVIYGAGGAVGRAVALAFAANGAKLYLSGRNKASVEETARLIGKAGVAVAVVDALDEAAIEGHADQVVRQAGRLDISFNAITAVPQPGTQGIPIALLPVDSFLAPITLYLRSHFLTARAAARRMAEAGTGVILMHTPEPARLGAPLVGGMGPAWAAMEALSRNLSAEFAAKGVRSVVLRSTGLPETKTIDVVFGLHAQALGISRDQFRGFVEMMTHRKRSSALAEVTNAAVFAASDAGSGMTGTVVNLTGGLIVD